MSLETEAAAAALAKEFDRLIGPPSALPNLAARTELAASLRGRGQEVSRQLDGFLIDQVIRGRRAVERAGAEQKRLRATFERLTAPPWFPAVFLGTVESGSFQLALVAHGQSRRVVSVVEEIDLSALATGDDVLLGPEMNLLVARGGAAGAATGETATFDRTLADGRVVVRLREAECVGVPARELDPAALRSGHLVRFDRVTGVVHERIKSADGSHLFLEETPEDTIDRIGGLDDAFGLLTRQIQLTLTHPEIVARYQSRPKRSVLLVGPPGNGKTLLARAFANWAGSLSASGRSRFMHIPPARLHSMWYAQSEANYREAFRTARDAAQAEPGVPVVMFFDEVDSIATARAPGGHRVDDRVLTAFMAELDGLEDRGDVLVLAATNRLDVLDPAITRPGRLGDLIVEVPRPGREAGRAILAKHLRAHYPYRAAEPDARSPRDELLDAAAWRIYAPNGLGDLATLVLRDGKRLPVLARDLVSGAMLAKIAADAVDRAQQRELAGGEIGIGEAELFAAIDLAFEAAVAALTPLNCRQHLDRLPHDTLVARIERPSRPSTRTHRHLELA